MFKVKINPYIESLFSDSDSCPIKAQFLPSIEEDIVLAGEMEDAEGEVNDTHFNVLIHKYPGRCLLHVSNTCAALCRFCTRKRIVEKEYIVTDNDFIQAFEYIKEEKLQDVLLSGGDPFMLSVERIEWFLHNLSKIQSLKVIRFGSRIISTYPMLITQKLCDILKKYDIKYINTHFNHPKEITIETIKAVNLLRSSGINIGNQTVLLKGINDNNDTMKELCLSLYHIGIKPYYIYHCDMVKGCSKFRTTIEKGISVYQSLRGYVSGPAIPLYILDFPYGLGKVPVNRNYFEKLEENVYRITNYSGKTMIYDERLFNLGD